MITLKNISAEYVKNEVLHHLNLQIKTGDFITIIGPNGSGKSTLLKILAGQLEPSTGSIFLNNASYSTLTPKQRALYIAYYPQMRSIPNMRVQTFVSHGRFPHLGFGHIMSKEDEKKVKQAMHITQTFSFKERFVGSLSGGEKQRVFLALLIAQDTPFILLDEPTAFLDICHQIDMMDMLVKLNNMGKTIVLVAHDLPSAFTFAKRIIVLNNGNIVADEPPHILKNNPCIAKVFGVCVQKLSTPNRPLLYPYVLVKK